jgi:hypothetical protein
MFYGQVATVYADSPGDEELLAKDVAKASRGIVRENAPQ